MINVAMVMPEIGFEEFPINPVIRDDTVTKKDLQFDGRYPYGRQVEGGELPSVIREEAASAKP